jgi:hypothetical protein
MLGSLLPALWLLTTGQVFPGFIGNGMGERCTVSLAAAQPVKPIPVHASDSGDPSARGWNRRVWIDPGPGYFPAFLEQTTLAPSRISDVVRLDVSERFLELAQSWQFRWRTAPEPRAPSLIG